MNKLLILLSMITFINTNAQDLIITPDTLTLNLTEDIEDKKIDFTIKNNLSREAEFYWTINSENVPSEWEFYFCDNVTCYQTAIQSCPCGSPNILGPNELSAVMMMHIVPNGVVGMGTINLAITSSCDDLTTTIVDIPIDFNVDKSTSTEFVETKNKVRLFPNPTTDFINLEHDSKVARVEIYNIIGKKVVSFNHNEGQSHDISSFNSGIYLVSIFDGSNKMIDVIRISK